MADRSRLEPTARALRFCFSDQDCLYRDHHGRRVLADIEGPGEFRIDRSESSLQMEVDGRLFDSTKGRFADSFIAGSYEVGDSAIAGRPSASPGGEAVVAGSFEGSGWVIRAGGPFLVDDRHEPAPMPDEFLAIPFFQGVQSSAQLEIVPVATRCLPVATLDINDSTGLKEHQWSVQNASKLIELDSTFEDGVRRVASVVSHLGPSSFNLALPIGSYGLILRKTYDRFHGRQRARVLVDGASAGWWYEPRENRQRRWAVSDFGVEEGLIEGKSAVRVTIDPVAGGPLWSFSRIEVFALLD